MSNTCIYYVYAYINKKTGKPYYIGKGKNKRAFAPHGAISVPKDKTKIVFIETQLSEIGAFALERRLIQWWGRKDNSSGILLNRTEGGEGPGGKIVSPETGRKISIAKTGKRVGPPSEETKRKIGDANRGKIRQPPSEETRQKLRKPLEKPRKLPPPMTDETRQKMRGPRGKQKNPGVRGPRGPYGKQKNPKSGINKDSKQ
jgi:hypothetical protein